MAEPEVALVFSPETWVEGLHRHLTDHGGARVRQVVMDPALALEEEYGTLIVSHRWPALNRAFVDTVHAHRRRVLGVFDPDELAGREYLLQLGADRVIESDAPMSEFLAAVAALAPNDPVPVLADTELSAVFDHADQAPEGLDPRPVVVVAGPSGGGATEVAIELARDASESAPAVLVDADDVMPAVAQRLARTIEPNLRTAVDAVEYGMGDFRDSLVSAPGGDFSVVCGLPNVAAWSQVRPGEVLDVVAALAHSNCRAVVNVSGWIEDLVVGLGRSRHGLSRALIGAATALVAVGSGTPVGVTRLLGWIADVRALTDAPIHLVINRCPPDGFRRAELADEIHRTFRPAGLWFVPVDPRVDVAAWSGELVAPGPFTRAVLPIARAIATQTAPVAHAGAR